MADEEIKSNILPNIMGVREEFFVFTDEQSITVNQAAYNIPKRAIGMIVREVQIIDAAGTATDLPRIEPEAATSSTVGSPNAFYLKGNQVILYPTPSASTGTLRQLYFLRPGNLVELTSAGVISSINTGTNAVTVTTIPSTWATGNVFDFIKQDGAHEYISIENTSSNVSGNVITFSALPSTLRVGDYVALAGESPLVQLPPDYQPVLAQCVAAAVLGNMNQPGADKAAKEADKMLTVAQKAITPRVVGEDRVILNQNWW